jgi:hypothetical protein
MLEHVYSDEPLGETSSRLLELVHTRSNSVVPRGGRDSAIGTSIARLLLVIELLADHDRSPSDGNFRDSLAAKAQDSDILVQPMVSHW